MLYRKKNWQVYQRGARFRIGYEYKTFWRGRIKVKWYQYWQGCWDGGDWITYETRSKPNACDKLAEVLKEEDQRYNRSVEQQNYTQDEWKEKSCD